MAVVATEAQAGRGMVREDRGRDLDSAAEEWEEAAEGRDRAQVAEERGPEVPEGAVERVRAAACGKPAPAGGRGLVVAQVPVVARAQVVHRDQAEADREAREELEGEQVLEVREQELAGAELERVERELREDG